MFSVVFSLCILSNIYMRFLPIILGLLLVSIIFSADVLFNLGAISLFYVCFIIAVFWTVREKNYLVSAVIISLILTIAGWILQTRATTILIDLEIFKATLDYEGLFRVVSLSVLMFVGAVLFKQKQKEDELQKLNAELELRILARTTVSETKAKRLEQQIEVLQGIRRHNTYQSIDRLDRVISELKELNKMETSHV